MIAVRRNNVRSAKRQRDQGLATIWAAGASAALIAVAALAMWLGAAVTTRHRASAAADLGALAAASHATSGGRHACARAGWVVERMGGRLTSCRLAGLDALVEVALEPSGVLGRFGPATARARAGPAER